MYYKYFIILLSILIFTGCATISTYDHYSYTQTTSIKVDALTLIDNADEDASLYTQQIQQLQVQVEKMYEYEKGRPDNTISASMWGILKDPERHMLGGFLKRWQEEKILKRVFIDEAKKLIAQGFDLISGLESGKIKADDTSITYKTIFF